MPSTSPASSGAVDEVIFFILVLKKPKKLKTIMYASLVSNNCISRIIPRFKCAVTSNTLDEKRFADNSV